MIEFKSVTYKRAKNTIFDEVNFKIETGDIVALIGPNGAGKTSLMKLILGLLLPSKGKIFIKGKKLDKQNRHHLIHGIGALIEKPAFYGFMTVGQNIKLHARMYEASDQQIDHIVSILDLKKHLNLKSSKLSFGFKQRLGLAIAMMGDCHLLLLDEPFNGLDFSVSNDLEKILNLLKVEQKMTMIISSHETHHLSSFANKVLYFQGTKLYFESITKEVSIEVIRDRLVKKI